MTTVNRIILACVLIATINARRSTRPEMCEFPPIAGDLQCDSYRPMFTFDRDQSRCIEFIYGGCKKSDNLFDSINECEEMKLIVIIYAFLVAINARSPMKINRKPDFCYKPPLEPEVQCMAYYPVYTYDAPQDRCIFYKYGCATGGNMFHSIEQLFGAIYPTIFLNLHLNLNTLLEEMEEIRSNNEENTNSNLLVASTAVSMNRYNFRNTTYRRIVRDRRIRRLDRQERNRKRREERTCSICYEDVYSKKFKAYGVLQNCTHLFCLQCIHRWRSVRNIPKQTRLACPVCRVKSLTMAPSCLPPNKLEKMSHFRCYKSLRISKLLEKLVDVTSNAGNFGPDFPHGDNSTITSTSDQTVRTALDTAPSD
ncbi:hypothetical protein GJ496_009277 [Pomphorhynchus laevis]|nr:hypothetical protein GJ496_009277 [Pomphorhynchus laevis]